MARNRFAGPCYRCGETVQPGGGHFERIPGVGWRVQHAECAIAFRGTKVGITEPQRPRPKTDPERFRRQADMHSGG